MCSLFSDFTFLHSEKEAIPRKVELRPELSQGPEWSLMCLQVGFVEANPHGAPLSGPYLLMLKDSIT